MGNNKSIYQEKLTIMNVYSPNIGTSKYIKKTTNQTCESLTGIQLWQETLTTPFHYWLD